ncbi:MAG: UDP-N-acetylmuramoyl-L-alanine--D-glutamate ligase [bacterium]
MAKNRLQGKRVAVIGLGREGVELARFLAKQEARVTILDRASAKQLGKNYQVMKAVGIDFELGDKYLDNLASFEIVYRSPGVPLELPALKQARKRGVEISSGTKLFLELCPAKVIGITGTKGKSTTASLVHHLLRGSLSLLRSAKAGTTGGQAATRGNKEKSRVYMAGNIGHSPLPLLGKLKRSDWVILELSSFQLEDMTTSPNIAVLLNVVPEHLDRHKTFSRYLAAKKNIYLYQKRGDWLVASQDFPVLRQAAKETRARVFPYSTHKILRKGLYLAKGEIVYRQLNNGKRQSIAPIDKVPIRGEHNLQNVLAAIGVAILGKIKPTQIAKRLASFRPLHHRLELVREIGGVRFINDSLATTPEAATAAVQTFDGEDIALIVGGVYKGGDIRQLAQVIERHSAIYVALIGESANRFAKVLAQWAPSVHYEKSKDLKQAIKAAYASVKADGGVVVLAPACASFDMFKDAYDRGEQFKIIAKTL